jgi:hypothetical protein
MSTSSSIQHKVDLCISSLNALKCTQQRLDRGEKKGHCADCLGLCQACVCFEAPLQQVSQGKKKLGDAQLDVVYEALHEVDRFIELYATRNKTRGMTSPLYLKKYVEDLASVQELLQSASSTIGTGSSIQLKRSDTIKVFIMLILTV